MMTLTDWTADELRNYYMFCRDGFGMLAREEGQRRGQRPRINRPVKRA